MTVPSLPPRAPAPPEPSPGERPARPDSLTILLQLAPAAIVLELVAFVGGYGSTRDEPQVRDAARRYAEQQGAPQDVDRYQTLLTVGTMAVSGVLAVAVVVAVALLVLTVRGYSWARFGVTLFAAVVAVTMLFDVVGVVFDVTLFEPPPQLPGWAMVARILGGVAALGVMLAATHTDTRRYVARLTAARAQRTSRPGQGSRS